MTLDVIVGKKTKSDYFDRNTYEVFLINGEIIDQIALDRLDVLGLGEVEVEQQGITVRETGPRWYGVKRYKSAEAISLLRPGTGEMRVNGEPVWDYFEKTSSKDCEFLRQLLELNELKDIFKDHDLIVWVDGSSPDCKRQVHAIAHSIAQAIINFDCSLKNKLEKAGYKGIKCKIYRSPNISEQI